MFTATRNYLSSCLKSEKPENLIINVSNDKTSRFWGTFDRIYSAPNSFSYKVKRLFEFVGASGLTDGLTYGSFGWGIGGEIAALFSSETILLPIIFAVGGAFSAGIFGINNVHREYQSLVYWAPNRNIRKGNNTRLLSRILGSSLALIAMIPFAGMAMSAFENWPISTFFIVWHSTNRLLMNDQALRVLADELTDFILASLSSKSSNRERKELTSVIDASAKKMLANGGLNKFQNENLPENKFRVLLSYADNKSEKTSTCRTKMAKTFGGLGFCLGAGTGLYLYNFSYQATLKILNGLFDLSCTEDELNTIAILGLIPTMVLWGEDTARVFYKFLNTVLHCCSVSDQLTAVY